MNVQQAYNTWALQYDTNINKTRDLEASALRTILSDITFNNCLEIGCGTGKNTAWLVNHATHITAVDLSGEMLAKAKEKITAPGVQFKQADITQSWTFADRDYDMVGFSLVLEHIENLNHIFSEVSRVLKSGGHVYIGELHPFKQYSGSKARFDTHEGQQVVTCFTHHISDFTQIPKQYGLQVVDVQEWFDDDDKSGIPRILSVVLRRE